MEKCKRKFSVQNPIGTGINSLTSSLALMAEEGRNLGDILNTELQECAYFCHVSRESTCIASAYDLPAAANKICGEELTGGAEAGNAPKANEGSKGVPVAYPAPRGVQTFLLKRLLSLSTRARATKHSRPPSHPHLLSDTSGLGAMPLLGAARVFALCHQQGKRDSSVLKMEVCRACFVAREKAGALSCGSDGTASLRSAAAGAEGSAAQRLYREGGRRT